MQKSESEILEIVLDTLRPVVSGGAELDADTQLLESGAIDSAAIVTVLLELELRLGRKIQAGDLNFDHFQSARTLARRFASSSGS